MDRERVQFVVYSNIAEFLTYRHISSPYKFLDQKEFSKEISLNKYIIIEGETSARFNKEKVVIVFVGMNSAYAAKLAEFKKVFKVASKAATVSKGTNCNIIFITPEDVTSNIRKSVAEEGEKGTYFEFHNYNKFIIVVPRHVMVPEHSIMPEAEAKAYMEEYFVDKYAIPKILSSDPAVVWIGGRGGDIIRIVRTSENSGIAITYRRVIEVTTI